MRHAIVLNVDKSNPITSLYALRFESEILILTIVSDFYYLMAEDGVHIAR